MRISTYKASYFSVEMLTHENVPWYQVSVQSVVRMQEHHPPAHVPHLRGGGAIHL